MCGIIANHFMVTGTTDKRGGCECLRPRGHQGEHAVKGYDGRFWAFWTDLTCDCEDCQSDEPNDWCQSFAEIGQRETGELMMSKDLVIYDKWVTDD
jgi:hypothetical protein